MSPTNSLPSAPDLIRSIANRLPRAVTYGGQASGPDAVPDYDIYEAYLFSLIVGVAQDMGYAVDYLTSDLTSATTLHFRRKPAPIYSHGSASSSSGYRQFTHARLSYPGRADLELHVGVQVAGTSKVAHEADVLIIDSEAAERARRKKIHPPSSASLLILEAKYYKQRSVGLAEARNFLGLHFDTSASHYMLACTVAQTSPKNLLAHRLPVELREGVLPNRLGERSLSALINAALTRYANRL